MTTTCNGLKNNGEPCGSTLGLSPAGRCLNHDPERQEAARQVRIAGGIAAGKSKRERRAAAGAKGVFPDDVPAVPKTLDDATKYYAWIVNAVATGRLDARSGHECSFALHGFRAAAEKRDLEREIKKLRDELAEARRPKRA
ncbi:hypothetical protein BH11GEM2_BH11GEM2_06720 [soil metagenome]